MASAGMAMAGAGARSLGGGARGDLDSCPAGLARYTANNPHDRKGSILVNFFFITGLYTPLHTVLPRRVLITYGVVVWGPAPRGTAESSSPAYGARTTVTPNAAMTITNGG